MHLSCLLFPMRLSANNLVGIFKDFLVFCLLFEIALSKKFPSTIWVMISSTQIADEGQTQSMNSVPFSSAGVFHYLCWNIPGIAQLKVKITWLFVPFLSIIHKNVKKFSTPHTTRQSIIAGIIFQTVIVERPSTSLCSSHIVKIRHKHICSMSSAAEDWAMRVFKRWSIW